jgi:hypothetical protein
LVVISRWGNFALWEIQREEHLRAASLPALFHRLAGNASKEALQQGVAMPVEQL